MQGSGMEARPPSLNDILFKIKVPVRTTAALLLGSLSCTSLFADVPYGRLTGDVIDGLSWTFQITDENTALVGGGNLANEPYAISSNTAGELIIPDYFLGCPTVHICWCAFSGFKKITSVVIPDTVAEISTSAFAGCKNLSSIGWPSGLKTVGVSAFSECSSLTEVVLPSGVEELKGQAFYYCTALSKIEIPTVRYIRDAVFKGCKKLTSISLPEEVEVVQDFVFEDCTALTTIRIPTCTKSIGRGLCAGATNLTSISVSQDNQKFVAVNGVLYDKAVEKVVAYVPSREIFEVEPSVSSIGKAACYKCRCLRIIRLPAALTKIESEAFKWNAGISSVSFPPNLKTIDYDAFYACTSLRSIVFPKSVESVGARAFESCPLEVVFVEQGDVERTRTILKNSKMAVDKIKFVELPTSALTIPWSYDYYERFSSQYDPDVETAMKMSSGKRTTAGEEMFVWQDFVAGTDPLDASSKFEAVISLVDGIPIVTWKPELSPEQAALRKYTTYGKASLSDEKWNEVVGDAAKYNFFKVTVEMK